MKKKTILRVVILLLAAGTLFYGFKAFQKYQKEKAHQAWVTGLVSTASPNVHILKDTIEIDYSGEKRTLSVYLPPNYETDTVDYPVLYFMDGSWLFDEKILEGDEWQLDEVLDSLAAENGMQAIVIGVYNSDKHRLTEYKPFLSPYLPKEKKVTGVEHAEWIATDVKKWVDQRYRTKKDVASTTIGGASLGGLMAYYMITTYPNIYGGAFVFSPSLWVNDKVYELDQQVVDFSSKRIYMNAGAIEKPTVVTCQKLHDILLDRGMNDVNLRFDIEADLGHWQMTWRNGFKKAFPWILERE